MRPNHWAGRGLRTRPQVSAERGVLWSDLATRPAVGKHVIGSATQPLVGRLTTTHLQNKQKGRSQHLLQAAFYYGSRRGRGPLCCIINLIKEEIVMATVFVAHVKLSWGQEADYLIANDVEPGLASRRDRGDND